MNNPTVSIIIPVYQAEDFLSRCLNSITNQTFKDFELLLINDGSTDKSQKICNNYAISFNNIRVFHQKNIGPSAARNKGIDQAKGKFITFIDADDYIDKNYLEGFFVANPNPEKALIQHNYIREYNDGRRKKFQLPPKQFNRSQFSNLFYSIQLIKWWPFTWGKLYDLALVKEQGLHFKEDIYYGEDLIFLLSYLNFAKCFILSSHSYYYHYLYNPNSLTRSLYGYESEIKRFRIVRKQEHKLGKKFNFDKELKQLHQEHFSNYFYRALHSLYLPPHIKKKHKRIQILKEMYRTGDIDYIKSGPWSSAKVFKMAKRLIEVNQYSLTDTMLYFWYKYKFPRDAYNLSNK